MKDSTRVLLEAKIIKYVEELCKAQVIKHKVMTKNEIPLPLGTVGLQFNELQHKMWYFIRTHRITSEQLYKVIRELESKGFLSTTMNGTMLVIRSMKAAIFADKDKVDETRSTLAPKKLDTTIVDEVSRIAKRYESTRSREKEWDEKRTVRDSDNETKQTSGLQEETNKSNHSPMGNRMDIKEIDVAKDQDSLLDYLSEPD